MNEIERRQDWGATVQMAEAIAKSTLVPERYRNKANDIAVAALWGQEVGLGPMASLKHIVIIKGTPGFSAEGMGALVRKAGHSISGTSTPTEAVATGKRRDTGDEMEVVFSMADAQQANLTSNPTWKQYPKSMLWSRAVSQLCRQLFPDVLMGLSYTPEEVESFNGADGNGGPERDWRPRAHETTGLNDAPHGAPPNSLAPVVPVTEDGELIEPKRSTRRPPPGRRPAPQTSATSEPAVDAGSAPGPADEASGGAGLRDAGTPLAAPAPLASTTERAALRERLNALEGKARSVFRETYGELNNLLAKDVGKASDFIAEYEKGGA